MTVNAARAGLFYTYEDYCKLDDGKRYEIINGVIYLMSPAPNRKHQRTAATLIKKIGNYLEGKKCEVYPAPFDVLLLQAGETKKTASTTVQPDILVVCDENKLDDNSCIGAPDLIIEILSPSSVKMDKIIKRNLYELHGVREYWLVDPVNQTIDRFCYDENLKEYKKPESFYRDTVMTSVIFSGLQINLEEVFPEIIKQEELR